MTNYSVLRENARSTHSGWRLARVATGVALFVWLAGCSV